MATGGRFPSDMVLRKTGTMSSTADGADDSDDDGPNVVAAAAALPSSVQSRYGDQDPYRLHDVEAGTIKNEPGTIEQQAYPMQQQQQQQPIASAAPVQTQTYAPSAQPVNQAQPVDQQPAREIHPVDQSQPAQSQPSMARHESSYGDWMAPVAAGAAGVGAGVLGGEAYRRHQQQAVVPEPVPEQEEKTLRDAEDEAAISPTAAVASDSTEPITPTVPLTNDINSTNIVPVAALNDVPDGYVEGTSVPAPTSSGPLSAIHEAPLGGNERLGAHETGAFFPRVIRHDTELSVSQLHVPGEFPPQRKI